MGRLERWWAVRGWGRRSGGWGKRDGRRAACVGTGAPAAGGAARGSQTGGGGTITNPCPPPQPPPPTQPSPPPPPPPPPPTRRALVALPLAVEEVREKYNLHWAWLRTLRDVLMAPFFGNSLATRTLGVGADDVSRTPGRGGRVHEGWRAGGAGAHRPRTRPQPSP